MSKLSAISAPAGLDWVPMPLFRLSLEQYEEMVAAGIFTDRDQLHLINGLLVAKMTQNEPQCTADERCGRVLNRLIPAGWHVRSAKPIRLPSQISKPEPDRCIVRGEIRDYSQRSPELTDVGLVVEVSDSSLGQDRKLSGIYGASGIPVYWIVNLVDRQVEVYSLPYPEGYHARQDDVPGQSVPLVIDGVEAGRFDGADLLP